MNKGEEEQERPMDMYLKCYKETQREKGIEKKKERLKNNLPTWICALLTIVSILLTLLLARTCR